MKTNNAFGIKLTVILVALYSIVTGYSIATKAEREMAQKAKNKEMTIASELNRMEIEKIVKARAARNNR